MTLLKSLLLGATAGIVTVASAQAADLPTRKAAPAAEYVKVCTVGGVTGFVLPGSDTCMKISGYLTGQTEAGNVKDQYELSAVAGRPNRISETETVPARQIPAIGFSTRGQVNFDAVSNTAYGPLVAHIELQGDSGSGFDNLGGASGNSGWSVVVINSAYLTWAGLTAGKHGSFYDFFAGGPTWKDFISPDHSGTPINLLAYTASFGGGFGATISLEQPEPVNGFYYPGNAAWTTTENGFRSPDIVASLDVKQGWGKAHLAGVAHRDETTLASNTLHDYDKWGYGVMGAVMFNFPGMPGDDLGVQAVWTHAAIAYSGLTSPAWGEGDTGLNVNGIGTLFQFADAYWNGSHWSAPDAWSIAATGDFVIGGNFTISPIASYGGLKYSGSTPLISNKISAFDGGAVLDWSPVHNLDFALDLVYETSHQSKPTAYVGPSFVSNASGFNGRLRITRSF
jgi:hypothetical protein